MKRLVPPLVALLSALPAVASDDPFADFRIPDHTWRGGTAQFQVAGSHTATGGARTTGLQSSVNGLLSRSHDSDALQHSVFLNFTGSAQSQSGKFAPPPFPVAAYHEGMFSRTLGLQGMLSGALRAYPGDGPLGLDLSAFAQGGTSQYRSRLDYMAQYLGPPLLENDLRTSQANDNYSYDAGLDVSLGAGRVRDATVVYQVHLLEQRLLESGALSRELSPAARERLAALYYVKPDLSAAHERPDRFFWREVERILREDGALGERGLDPYSVVRAQEGYFPGIRSTTRLRGWFAGPVASLRHMHRISRSEARVDVRSYEDGVLVGQTTSSDSRRDDSYGDAALVGGRAEYHRPLGWRWQVDGTALAQLPVRSGEHGQTAQSAARLLWYIADRWEADASVQQDREWFRPRRAPRATVDHWAVSYRGTIGYYIEDHLTLSASITEYQNHDGFGSGYFSRSGAVSVGLAWRFLGAFDAPGLVEPMRPI